MSRRSSSRGRRVVGVARLSTSNPAKAAMMSRATPSASVEPNSLRSLELASDLVVEDP